jgi:tetratricopeptide (TPR) repeat protein
MVNYQNAANLEPNGPADYFNRAMIAASLFNWDETIRCLRAVVGAKPDFWQAHYRLGIQLAASGKIEESQDEFSAAIHDRPDFVPARLNLGISLASQGRLDRALVELRAVLQLDPANESARHEMETIENERH